LLVERLYQKKDSINLSGLEKRSTKSTKMGTKTTKGKANAIN